MAHIHEVNKRIIDEINKDDSDHAKKEFILEILDFELEHFDERNMKHNIRFRESYNNFLEKALKKTGKK